MNNSRPLVSVVTSSFNQGIYLEQTIQSVLAQTYPNIEYIVIDGGSTDSSIEIIKQYQDRIAYWHSRPDRGFADAIRQGFEHSHGQILAYLNSDDLLAPDAVEKAVTALDQKPEAIMVYGNRVCIDQGSQVLYMRPNLPFLTRSPYIAMSICQESCFWRRDAYFQVGGINPEIKFGIDYELFSKLTLFGKIFHDGRIWGFFRKHPASKTMTQYRTLGKKENTLIQNAHWGGPAVRIKWLSALMLIRTYALLAGLFLQPAHWPALFPPASRPGFFSRLQRYIRSFASRF